MMPRTFYEFFAGGGMVRAGLGPGWSCLAANDIDPAKAASYAANGEDGHFILGDVATLAARDLPGSADLAWASFPCQDLSLAGRGRGLNGERSGTFFAFRDLLRDLWRDGRAPAIVAVENVCGLLTANCGDDFAAVVGALAAIGYRVGAMVIDAERFLPQSRPRLFIVGVSDDAIVVDPTLCRVSPLGWTTTKALAQAHAALPDAVAGRWIWWNSPEPPRRNATLADLLEPDAADLRWRTQEDTQYLLSLMSDANRAKVDAAKQSGDRQVGAIYRRTRRAADGSRAQRAEVRFDGLAGCLRTPAGGSSRQSLLIVEGHSVRSRLVSPREAARLMGLPDDYRLPSRANEAYHLLGDGVAAPIIAHLARSLFEPLLATPRSSSRMAAE